MPRISASSARASANPNPGRKRAITRRKRAARFCIRGSVFLPLLERSEYVRSSIQLEPAGAMPTTV